VNISAPFIRRPAGTTLLTIAVALSGIIAFRLLPVSPLPQVDFPTIFVNAGLPGASPATMASAVATPLERQLGRIAGVTEMTSTSYLGSTSITLQFDLSRNIDAAARDVQAAINAARGNLPTNLPNNPGYRKVNPADAPVLIFALTSDVIDKAQMYDIASSVIAQKLSQVSGVGQVFVGGSSLPAVRVELNPMVVNDYGISMEQIRNVLSNANANRPKGEIPAGPVAYQIRTTDQLLKAAQYMPLIVAYHNGTPVRLSELGRVTDSVEDLRNAGLANGKPAILVVVFRQPAANIIDTVDRVRALVPEFQASIPPTVKLNVMMDRTTTIRASIRDVELTLMVSIFLVILVVFAFLRNGWATLIPSVAVPLSLIGTFGIMYLFNYSIDNLSLMALTICTGFVVDDAIVVIENITRHLEAGLTPMAAAMQGAQEIGFTVLSMSTSLVAVFLPILLMGGIVGRLFREFAVTLSAAIIVSLLVSLTATPMMCAHLLKRPGSHGRLYRASERVFQWILDTYATTLRGVLRHPAITMIVLLLTITLNVILFAKIPKGFFPLEDTGRMMGMIRAQDNTSFQAMRSKVTRFVNIVMADPAIDSAVAFTGGQGGVNTGRMFIALKDLDQRKSDVTQVMARIRRKAANVPGATLLLQPVEDIRVGGRLAGAEYQYTLQTQDLNQLNYWAARMLDRMRALPGLVDVNTDQQNNGLEAWLDIDRDTASRLGLSMSDIDAALYDAFGQRPVSTMYTQLNQYHVIMEVAPEYWQSPQTLQSLFVNPSHPIPASAPIDATSAYAGAMAARTDSDSMAISAAAQTSAAMAVSAASTTSANTAQAAVRTTSASIAASQAASNGVAGEASTTSGAAGNPAVTFTAGAASSSASASAAPGTSGSSLISAPIGHAVPLSAFVRLQPSTTPIAVNHQGQFPSATISFNLRSGVSLGAAVVEVNDLARQMGLPATVQGSFSGTAEAFQSSVANEPVLIVTALIAVYIVLGILYESYMHPITILSTLPSAGVGALLALLLFHEELTVISLIGIILLIGIVKKNAILMIDFALDAERREGKNSRDAIYEACLLRFRPITMTTMAAMFGALPLALGTGMGHEFRRPLGITIVGGLLVSQLLTLYTTPVVYLVFDRMRWKLRRLRGHSAAEPELAEV
jgi:multidrug efflux pump